MKKVDRLGWADGLVFRSYGRHVGVRSNAPEVLDRMRPLFPPGAKPAEKEAVRRLYSLRVGDRGARKGVRKKHTLYMNATVLERSLDLDYLLDRFEADVQLYIAERARRRIFVHAGVVAWQGRAIVMPGRSMTGKTTLVTELLRQGATYYSGEYAVLDDKGRVHPFPRKLSVREGGFWDPATRLSASEWDARTGRGPIPIGMVVLATYREGATWKPQRLPLGRAVLAVLENAVPARRRPKVTLRTIQTAIEPVPIVKGTRGDAEAAAAALIRSMSREYAETHEVEARSDS